MDRPKVLVVDDDALVLRAALRAISGSCEADGAAGGADAVSRLRGARYDMVVSDVDMPGIDGPNMMFIVCKEHIMSPAAFVFMSGTSDSDKARRLVAQGIPVVPKGSLGEDLLPVLMGRMSGLRASDT